MIRRILDLDGDLKVIIPPFLNIMKKFETQENFRKLSKENYRQNFTRWQAYKLKAPSSSFIMMTSFSSSSSHLLTIPKSLFSALCGFLFMLHSH